MTAVTESSALYRFATDDFPDRDKASVWRDHFGDAIVNMDMTALGDEPFRSVCYIRALPDLNVWWCSITESEVRRTPVHVADADDSLVLAIVGQGRTAIVQSGREAVIGHGEALLWSAERTGVYRNLSAAGMVCLKFSRRSLAATVPDLERTLMTPIPASNEALRLLTSYVEIMRADPGSLAPELQALGVPHIHDLASLALGATRDARERAEAGGLSAARLHAIKADILANLASPDLGVDAIAARCAISPRYMRTLFERDHTTFTDFLREQRLRRAYRILSDPASLGRSIGTVALDCGYASISYFNQAFRRRYGATPTDIRNSAAKDMR
ncbi:MAG: AraC family transcriptional regulator [Bauldia sp.]